MPRAPLACLLLLLAAASARAEEPAFAPRPFAEVAAEVARLAARHAEAELLEIGRSAGKRPLLVVRVAGPGPLPRDQRPALFVGANICGDRPLASEAALDLLAALLEDHGPDARRAALLGQVCFYVAPALNPDAHDACLRGWGRRGDALALDADRDGLVGEDGPDDLDGDGRLRWLRIEDPAGEWVEDPREPRLLVKAEAALGERGRYRLEVEGRDDDDDGRYNEDAAEGVVVDRNFAHGWPYPDPRAGAWPSAAPEAKAVMDFLLARRHVAAAIVYGEANSLLTLPAAAPFPKDPSQAATGWLPEDRDLLAALAARYRAQLEARDLPRERATPPESIAGGSLSAWLYYHYGALALELDVWGVPGEREAKRGGLSLEELGGLSPAALLEKPAAALEGLLEQTGAPRARSAEALRAAVEAGSLTPRALALELAPYAEHAGTPAGKERRRQRAELAWWSEARPAAVSSWTRVSLPGEGPAEVGGLDPLADRTPPRAAARAALAAHTAFALDLAARLGRVELRAAKVSALGGGVFQLEVVAGCAGALPTHTAMAARIKVRRPVRLALTLPEGARLVTGQRWAAQERLAGGSDVLKTTWLVQGPPGAALELELGSEQAGQARRALRLEETR
ncbi:MAG: M14 family zinc carboxypeptidase [Planctomycetota bacterium]